MDPLGKYTAHDQISGCGPSGGQLVEVSVYASKFGYVTDNVTDNGPILDFLTAYMRTRGGGRLVLDGAGIGLSSVPLVLPSFTHLEIEGILRNTATSGWSAHGIIVGDWNRTDIARSKGQEETSYDGGMLFAGTMTARIGGRWSERDRCFSNTSSWVPEVGDTIILHTDDDVSAEQDSKRPVPSITVLRQIVAVTGSLVTLDKSVPESGRYVIVPACRGLGYDRKEYGGVGRVEVVTDSSVCGRIDAPFGHPVLNGASIRCRFDVDVYGQSIVSGNGFREAVVRARGTFDTKLLEAALGTEDAYFEFISGSHVETGEEYSVGLVQIAERARGVRLGRIRVDAPLWAGPDAVKILGTDIAVCDLRVTSAATSRLLVIGSASMPATGMKVKRPMEISSTIVTNGYLMQITASKKLDISVVLRGSTHLATAVLTDDQSGGLIRLLQLPDEEAPVRLNGTFDVNEVKIRGQLVRKRR